MVTNTLPAVASLSTNPPPVIDKRTAGAQRPVPIPETEPSDALPEPDSDGG